MLTALVLLAGCGNDGAGVPAAPPPPEVGVLSIEPRELQLHVELPGRTSAYLVAEVRPQVSGIIRERRFTEGAEVDRGAPLYVIDPDTYQAEVATAEAALAKAEAAANTTANMINAAVKPSLPSATITARAPPTTAPT